VHLVQGRHDGARAIVVVVPALSPPPPRDREEVCDCDCEDGGVNSTTYRSIMYLYSCTASPRKVDSWPSRSATILPPAAGSPPPPSWPLWRLFALPFSLDILDRSSLMRP